MSLDIKNLELTDEEESAILWGESISSALTAVRKAQLAKALWGIHDWLVPFSSEQDYLEDELLAAGIERPKTIKAQQDG